MLCLIIGISGASAQTVKAVAPFKSETTGKLIDTTANATTKCQILEIKTYWTSNNVQVTATKVSGTAAGVVRLWVSNDKVGWLRSTATGTLAATDSLNLANVAGPQFKFFEVSPKYAFYRACLTGSGTQATAFATTAVGGK